MARITPTSNAQTANLEDDEPYLGTLTGIDSGNSDFGPQLVLDWELEDGSSVRDWLGFSIGINNKGIPAKLRQLCNALSDRPPLDEISWFDDESYEWSYQGEDGRADNKLVEGMTVKFRGQTVQRKDGVGTRYAIQKYQMTKTPKVAAARGQSLTTSPRTPRVVRPVPDDIDPDEAPF